MIAIRGAGSRIAEELIELLPASEEVIRVPRGNSMPLAADRYLFCQGLLRPSTIGDQTPAEVTEGFAVNAGQVMAECERIIAGNERARICVIGSESGFSGSFDGVYATAKAALHKYVETRRLRTSMQQLVCVAPSIISDCHMTLRRTDGERLSARAAAHPKGRFLMAAEVASLVYFLLYRDRGYLTNTVIRMHGGEPCR